MHIPERRHEGLSVSQVGRRSGIHSCFGMFSPWLQHDVRFTGSDDVTWRSFPLVCSKTADVVFVAMRGHHRMQFTPTLFLDVLSDAQHEVFTETFLLSGASEVNQYMAIADLAAVMEAQKKTIAESHLIAA